tara:strand:+ start:2967 stop:3752 length:786 start_codon:yes stop_codon:yes gene_type:complete
MNKNITRKLFLKESGQAVIELLVASIFLLVPMAIGMSYIAKVGHTQHKLHEAARYASFEKTKWSGGHYNSKTNDEIAREINTRIFSSGFEPIDSVKDKQSKALNTVKVNPFMKFSHKGRYNALLKEKPKPLNSYVKLSTSLAGLKNAGLSNAIGKVVSKGLDLGKSGIETSTVNIELQKLDILPLPAVALTSSSRVALLNNSWNARGPSNVKKRIKKLVPTSFVSGLSSALSSVTSLGLSGGGNLELGIIKPDIIPRERMK